MTSLDSQITETQTAVTNMMNTDSFIKTDQTVILTAFSTVVAEKNYVNTIIDAVKQIMADGAFTMADLPNVLIIVTTTQSAISKIITNSMVLSSSLKSDSMKYIVYGVMRFVFVNQGISTVELDALYSSLWQLLEINPSAIAVKVKSCFGCCSSNSVKSSTTATSQMIAVTQNDPTISNTTDQTVSNTNEPSA